MTEQEINNLIDSKIGKTKMSQLPEATQTSGLYSIGYTGNQSVKYKANLLQGDPLTVRKTYQTEALALADKNPVDPTTSLPLTVGQFVSIVDDGEKNGIYRISSIGVDGTMSLELQGKLGDMSLYAKKSEVDNITISEDGTVKKDGVGVELTEYAKKTEANTPIQVVSEQGSIAFETGRDTPSSIYIRTEKISLQSITNYRVKSGYIIRLFFYTKHLVFINSFWAYDGAFDAPAGAEFIRVSIQKEEKTDITPSENHGFEFIRVKDYIDDEIDNIIRLNPVQSYPIIYQSGDGVIEVDNASKKIIIPKNLSFYEKGDLRILLSGEYSTISIQSTPFTFTHQGMLTYKFNRSPTIGIKEYNSVLEENEIIIASVTTENPIGTGTTPNSTIRIASVDSSIPFIVKKYVPVPLKYGAYPVISINGSRDIEINNSTKKISFKDNVTILHNKGNYIFNGDYSFISKESSFTGTKQGVLTYNPNKGLDDRIEVKQYSATLMEDEVIIANLFFDTSLGSGSVPKTNLNILKVISVLPFKILGNDNGEPKGFIYRNLFSLPLAASALISTVSNKVDFGMIHITDIHGDMSCVRNAIDLKNNFGGNTMLYCGGDIASHEPTIFDFTEYTNMVLESGMFHAIGQHEVGYGNDSGRLKSLCFSHQQVYETLIEPFLEVWGLEGLSTNYYYKDFNNNTRLIVPYQYNIPLEDDPSDPSRYKYNRALLWYGQSQIDWFVQSLLTAPEGYNIIIGLHQNDSTNVVDLDHPFSTTNLSAANRIIAGDIIRDIVRAFIERDTISRTFVCANQTLYPSNKFSINVNADFSNSKAIFANYIIGDTHKDGVGVPYGSTQRAISMTSSGIPYDCVIRKGDYVESDIINCFGYDYSNRWVKLARIGQQYSSNMDDRRFAKISL